MNRSEYGCLTEHAKYLIPVNYIEEKENNANILAKTKTLVASILENEEPVYVDFETQERIPKDSALWYKEVIKTNGECLSINDDRRV